MHVESNIIDLAATEQVFPTPDPNIVTLGTYTRIILLFCSYFLLGYCYHIIADHS